MSTGECNRSFLMRAGMLFLFITILAHGRADAAVGDRPIEALLPYWTPAINQRFTDTYADCAFMTMKSALDSAALSFTDVERQIGKSCKSYIQSTILQLQSLGLKITESKMLINYIYKDRQGILIDYYWKLANEKLDRFIDDKDKKAISEAKADHLDCIQNQVARYSTQSNEPANIIVQAAIGFCKSKEDKVAEILMPFVINHGGSGEQKMDEYSKNITEHATALVLEFRTRIQKPQDDVEGHSNNGDGI